MSYLLALIPVIDQIQHAPWWQSVGTRTSRLQAYAKWTATGCITLCRNPTSHRTLPYITLSQNEPQQSIWGDGNTFGHGVLDINHQWISDKSVLLRLPSAIPFPSSCPSYFHRISNTPPFIPVSPCFILHPYVPCFIDIHSHVAMMLLSLAYSFLTPFQSFLVSC